VRWTGFRRKVSFDFSSVGFFLLTRHGHRVGRVVHRVIGWR